MTPVAWFVDLLARSCTSDLSRGLETVAPLFDLSVRLYLAYIVRFDGEFLVLAQRKQSY